jgi:CRP/FNR family cyclic AMP-dependent transcriptional regulator
MADLGSDEMLSIIRLAVGEHLSAIYLDRLIANAEIVHRMPGEYLFREGQTSNELYVLLDGKVDLLMTVPGRGPQRILTVGRGELLAWSAIVGTGTMTCDAVSAANSSLLQISGERLLPEFAAEPRFGYQFMQWLAVGLTKRLTATRLQLLDLFARESHR